MNKGKRFKFLYLPALTIVITVLTLLVVIGISTYRNISRERERAEEFLLREGLGLARAIEAGLRVDPPQQHLDLFRIQKLITEVSQEPAVASIILFDEQGKVWATGKIEKEEEKRLSAEGIKDAPALVILLKSQEIIRRYQDRQEGKRFFEIIKPFRPFSFPTAKWPAEEITESIKEDTIPQWTRNKIILMRMHLETFEKARQEDILHAFLMGGILLVLGGGALYFIFIVQNYYLVDRTLAQMKTYTENVLESLADGIISVDSQGKIVTWNRRATEILGLPTETLKEKSLREILELPPESHGESEKEKREIKDQEVIFRPSPKKEIPLSLRITPLKDEMGQEMGSVILLRDLREIKDLQEKVRRSERLASLGRLAAGVAHEIRNPLSSIRGFAQYFLSRFKGQEEEQGYAAVMVKEVDRLNRVITELLDFARPKAPQRESHSLPWILDHTLQLLNDEIKKRRIEVEKDYAANLPLVFVDKDQISQAFLNLLLNSIESMAEGGKIRLTLRNGNAPKTVEVVIEDSGRGIPKEDLEKVFEPFFSTKRKGTGLGLAIVHQIIESHGGEIRVKSAIGKGTAISIILHENEKT
ncbi:MAG: two-component system sensor histidine kinase NtrB [Thermodesulfobacteriota bacterium]